MRENKRQKKFIDSAVQGALIRRLVVYWLGFVAVTFGTMVTLQTIADAAPGEPVFKVLQAAWYHNLPVVVIAVLMLPLVVFDSIKLSHRFAGPVTRLSNAMKAMHEGKKVPQITLRKNDFWHELIANFNRLTAEQGIQEPTAEEKEKDAATASV